MDYTNYRKIFIFSDYFRSISGTSWFIILPQATEGRAKKCLRFLSHSPLLENLSVLSASHCATSLMWRHLELPVRMKGSSACPPSTSLGTNDCLPQTHSNRGLIHASATYSWHSWVTSMPACVQGALPNWLVFPSCSIHLYSSQDFANFYPLRLCD